MLPMSHIQVASILQSSLPSVSSMATAALLSSSASTPLSANDNDDNHDDTGSSSGGMSPRARAVTYMASAASLHYAGYEFLRNAGLALFTSDTIGFSSAAAFPLASAAVSPFSILLLAGYARLLSKRGPRVALRRTTSYCIAFIAAAAVLLQCPLLPRSVHRAVIGVAFLFQNSYTYMLAGQHWSFTDSVVTPDEGARWFGTLTGVSSLLCTAAALAVPVLLPATGLIGLFSLTAVTLTASMLCADRAYALAQEHGFDPALQQKKELQSSKVAQVKTLFKRVPVLGALFCEGVSFQSLSTVLNVAMVQALKLEIPNDVARSAFTGRFYAAVSAVSAIFQFVVFPLFMKYSEPSLIWRIMPVLPMAICLVQASRSSSLALITAALFLTKVMDYAIRTVICNMVYQPLDFESRFMGKEVIGVFGSRFGKSGMSLALSGLSAAGMGLNTLYALSLTASTAWFSSTWWLSNLLPTREQAQKMVEERRRKTKREAVDKID